MSALEDAGQQNYADRLKNCGHQGLVVKCDGPVRHKYYIPYHCGFFLCPKCAVQKYEHIKNHYLIPHMDEHPPADQTSFSTFSENWQDQSHYRFLTLTVQKPWQDHMVSAILRYATKLVKILWDRPGEGAIIVLELSPSGSLHTHILIYGHYVSQARISSLWFSLTGSYVVDIRLPKSAPDVLQYMCKYITKVGNIDDDPDAYAAFVRFFRLIKNLRVYRVVGSFHSLRDFEDREASVCVVCNSSLTAHRHLSIIECDWFGIPTRSNLLQILRRGPPELIEFIEAFGTLPIGFDMNQYTTWCGFKDRKPQDMEYFINENLK